MGGRETRRGDEGGKEKQKRERRGDEEWVQGYLRSDNRHGQTVWIIAPLLAPIIKAKIVVKTFPLDYRRLRWAPSRGVAAVARHWLCSGLRCVVSWIRAQHQKLCERISHRDRDVRGAEGLLDFEIVRGAGSRVRRLRTLVADDQQGSSRLLATQGDACSGRRPMLMGDGTTMGEEPTAVEGGEGQSSMRVLSAGRELPGNYHIWFPKNLVCEVSHCGNSRDCTSEKPTGDFGRFWQISGLMRRENRFQTS
jgi:hypothetical protein